MLHLNTSTKKSCIYFNSWYCTEFFALRMSEVDAETWKNTCYIDLSKFICRFICLTLKKSHIKSIVNLYLAIKICFLSLSICISFYHILSGISFFCTHGDVYTRIILSCTKLDRRNMLHFCSLWCEKIPFYVSGNCA